MVTSTGGDFKGSLFPLGVAEGHKDGVAALVDMVEVDAPTYSSIIIETGEPI